MINISNRLIHHGLSVSLLFFTILAFSCASSETKEVNNDQKAEMRFVQGYDGPVRGVWLTNVASDALYTAEGIEQAVALCARLGLNTIFVVTWNKAVTMYPSQIMKELTGVAIDPELDPEGLGRDPLQEVIDAARRHGLKVFAWFEFGFAASFQENGGVLIERNPHWASLDYKGRLCTKNGFEWMNALNPEVQDFMLSLVLEVVENYEVDGIQGDDRLPAMPVECGYNEEVIRAFKEAHFGEAPPDYYKDFQWVQWRSEQLNKFQKRLYGEVKKLNPDCIVSASPSIFPWSKEEYLQDWPSWINFGYADMLCPQVYRKDSASYSRTLDATMSYVLPEKRHLVYPGVLIRVDDVQPSADLLAWMIAENRRHGLYGEVFFFYEGLHAYEDLLIQEYSIKP